MTQYVGNVSSNYPYSAVVYIEATYFQTGAVYTGSGVIVGENDVLTASHVIYSALDGGVADIITVYPGKDGWSEPFGSYAYALVNYFEIDNDDGLLYRSDSQYDLALLGFEEDLGNLTGWFGLDPYARSGYYNLTGYPGVYADYTGPRMTNDYGYAIDNSYYSVFDYNSIDSNSGNSGGPLWYEGDAGPYVVGIASTGGWAADISLNYSTIIDWIDGNNYLMNNSVTTDDYANNASTTGTVAVGGQVTGNIEVSADEDWFKVTLQAGTTYQIDLKGADTQSGTLSDPYLAGIYISGKSGVSLISGTSNKDGGVGSNSWIEFTPETSGQFFIAAGSEGGTTGSYTLSVRKDDYAANEATKGLINVGGSISGVIDDANDQDWFAVSLQAGTTYKIDLKGADTQDGTLADPHLKGIYSGGKSGATLISGTSNKDGGTGLNSRIEFTPEVSGNYYISAGTQNGGTGSYTLAVNIAVSPEMTLDWAEKTFPEIFLKRAGEHFPVVEYEGVIYTARAYSGDWGARYLGITSDEKIFGLGDFTGQTLQQFQTIDYWADQILADLNDSVTNMFSFAGDNGALVNTHNEGYSEHPAEIDTFGVPSVVDEWMGA